MALVDWLLGIVFMAALAVAVTLTTSAITAAEFWFARVCFISAALAVVAAYFAWRAKWRSRPISSLLVEIIFGLLTGGIVVIGLPTALYWVHSRELSFTPEIALMEECNPVFLPISILPHGTIHLLLLNRRSFKSVAWGSIDVSNDTDQISQWPSQERMARVQPPGNWPMAYKCEIDNLGKATLSNVGIPIRFWFGTATGEKGAITYYATISPIEARKAASLYLANECNEQVAAIMPETAKVKIAGAIVWREIPLDRKHKDPAELIMGFFPSALPWVDGEQCE
jgi:hypothetical protein